MAPVYAEPISRAARIERALVLLALFIELDGEIHVPLYERLEAELQRIRRTDDTKARARQLLADHVRAGAAKAISSKNHNQIGLHIDAIG